MSEQTTDRSARDLLFQDEVREAVRESYRAIPAGAGRRVAERLYSAEELAEVPEHAIQWALGVGNPVRHAALGEGEIVLDVGSGGGIDAVLAARRVGPGGGVIGLDTLPEMCDRARAAANEAGLGDRCRFLPAEMEDIPLPDASVDVVISNGVINLSPRKSRALAEIARVLRPGGRLCAADLTVESDLPPEVLGSDAAWAGCVAGAVSQRVLGRKLERVGFADVRMSERMTYGIDDVALYPLFTPEVLALMRRLIPAEAQGRVAVGVLVRGTRAEAAAARGRAPAGAAAGTSPEAPPKGASLAANYQTGARRLEDVAGASVEAPGVTVHHLKSVEDVELKVIDVEAGGSTPFHTHAQAHEGIVISGTGELRLSERSEPLGPGVVFSVSPTEPHCIAADDGGTLRFACMDCLL